MLSSTFLLLDFLVLSLLYAIYRAVRPQESSVPLPPGPKTSWLGSLSLPTATEYPWRVYSKWRELYGMPYILMLIPSSNVLQAMSSTSMSSEILWSFSTRVKPRGISSRIRAQSIHHVLAGQWSMNCELVVSNVRMSLSMFFPSRMGWDWIFSSMPYGDTWRKHRRLFHNHFNPAASLTYLDVQTKEAHSLLQSLAENPADFVRHIRR